VHDDSDSSLLIPSLSMGLSSLSIMFQFAEWQAIFIPCYIFGIMKVYVFWILISFGSQVIGQVDKPFIHASKYYKQLKVTGLSKLDIHSNELEGLFQVYSGDYYPGKHAIWGTYECSDVELIFSPRVPFQSGESYVAIFQMKKYCDLLNEKSNSKDKIIYNFNISDLEQNIATEVEAIFPSSDTLPENLLKFHIQFSRPMRRGASFDYISLIDKTTNSSVENVFSDFTTEFWNADNSRLTIYIDPGRVKKGLHLNHELGSPLILNHQYQLIIDSTWEDALGLPLLSSFVKDFTITRRDAQSPQLKNWKVTVPREQSLDALEISFLEPIDKVLAENSIRIIGPHGKLCKGGIGISNNEMRWTFFPEGEWAGGAYKILVYSALSDISGNMIKGLFDRNLSKGDRLDSVDNYILVLQISKNTLDK